MDPVRFLSLHEILVIHEQQLELYGGRSGLRELSLLESALFRPQTSFGGEDLYPTIFLKAAALWHSILLNHPFQDGNKRTSTVSTLTFLELNGYELKVKRGELAKSALLIEDKSWDLEKIASWLEKHSVKI